MQIASAKNELCCICSNIQRAQILYVYSMLFLTRLLSVLSSWHPPVRRASHLREEQGESATLCPRSWWIYQMTKRVADSSGDDFSREPTFPSAVSSLMTAVFITHWRLSASLLLLSSVQLLRIWSHFTAGSNIGAVSITSMHIMWNVNFNRGLKKL